MNQGLEDELRGAGDSRTTNDPGAFERRHMLIKARCSDDNWEEYMRNR